MCAHYQSHHPVWGIRLLQDSTSYPIPDSVSPTLPIASYFFEVYFQIVAPRVTRSSSFPFPSGFHVKTCRVMTGLRRVCPFHLTPLTDLLLQYNCLLWQSPKFRRISTAIFVDVVNQAVYWNLTNNHLELTG